MSVSFNPIPSGHARVGDGKCIACFEKEELYGHPHKEAPSQSDDYHIVCKPCLKKIEGSNCPICRRQIVNINEIEGRALNAPRGNADDGQGDREVLPSRRTTWCDRLFWTAGGGLVGFSIQMIAANGEHSLIPVSFVAGAVAGLTLNVLYSLARDYRRQRGAQAELQAQPLEIPLVQVHAEDPPQG